MITVKTIRLLLALVFMVSIKLIACSMFFMISIESPKHAAMAFIPFMLMANWDTCTMITEKIAGCKNGEK